MQLFEHRSVRCEDDSAEWQDETEVEFVDMKSFTGEQIDSWLRGKGFQWREQYRGAVGQTQQAQDASGQVN